jgi:hypothetical protein
MLSTERDVTVSPIIEVAASVQGGKGSRGCFSLGVTTLLLPLVMWAAPPNRTTRAEVVNLRVPVWADAGEALEAPQVEVKVDGSPATVVRLSGPSDDLMLLAVLDLAGDLTLVDPARQALVEGIRELPANTYVGLLRAQDGLRVLIDPGPDREQVARSILDLTVSGHSGLLNTIETATRLGDSVLNKAHVRLAVLYVKSLSRTQTPVFIVHLNYRSDRLNEAYQTGLLSLATATGGSAEFCRSLAEIPVALSKTLDTISSHHSLEIELPRKTSEAPAIELLANGRTLRYRSRFQLSGR